MTAAEQTLAEQVFRQRIMFVRAGKIAEGLADLLGSGLPAGPLARAALHEAGHFAIGRHLGLPVTEAGIGFQDGSVCGYVSLGADESPDDGKSPSDEEISSNLMALLNDLERPADVAALDDQVRGILYDHWAEVRHVAWVLHDLSACGRSIRLSVAQIERACRILEGSC